MHPDMIPSPKAAEPFEAHLRLFALAEPPASLDERIKALQGIPQHARQDAEAPDPGIEAQLLAFTLPEPPASLDARLLPLCGARPAPPVAASHPARGFWRQAAPWAAGLAAGVAAAFLLHTMSPKSADAPPAPAPSRLAVAPPAPAPVAPPTLSLDAPLDGAVPAGYRYMGTETVCTQKTPTPLVFPQDGQMVRAVRLEGRKLLRYQNPETRATYQVEKPYREILLEKLTSY